MVLTTQSGIDNTPVSGGFNFEDPVPSAAGNCAGCDTFSGTWGAGIQLNGPVSVTNLLAYLHGRFGPDNHIPVFTFDMTEPGSGAGDLSLLAKFSIFNSNNNTEVASWALDAVNNGVFDPAAFALIEGNLNFTGLSNTDYTIYNTRFRKTN